MSDDDHDKVAALARNLASPQVVAAIDAALDANQRERVELIDLRRMAIRRHGGQPRADDDGASDSQPETKDERAPTNLTFAELVHQYRTDEHSPIHNLRFNTRTNYEGLLSRIERDIGPERIRNFDEARLRRAHNEWMSGGKTLTMAHSLLAMVRILATFGAKQLGNRDCRELKLTLHDMRFERPPQTKSEPMTLVHAKAIMSRAHETGLPSVALGQALQYFCGLRQKDVIGEWVPLTEDGDFDVIDAENKTKWLRGITWQEIDQKWVLRHVTSFTGEHVELSLPDYPEVYKEIQAMFVRLGKPNRGPVIVDERTGLPYLLHTWRRTWRIVATEAGVPKAVKNMNSSKARKDGDDDDDTDIQEELEQ